MSIDAVLAVMPPSAGSFSSPGPYRLAIHEAGHAVARLEAHLPIDWVAVADFVLHDGRKIPASTHGMEGPPDEALLVALAGTAAEKIWATEPTTPWNVDTFGIGDLMAALHLADRLAATGSSGSSKAADIMAAANVEVVSMLQSRWANVAVLADALISEVALTGREVDALFA
jgi:hypothetical protein